MLTADPPAPPLLVLGLDTGDPDSIERWAAEGHLPTIADLMSRGCWGRTGGAELVCEYGVGLSLFSGISRGRHGHYYFRQLDPGTYDLVSAEASVAAAPPFWSELAGTEARVLAADVPDVTPIPGVAGLQLANWATHHGFGHGPQAEPPGLLSEARRSYGRRTPLRAGHNFAPRRARRFRAQLLDRVRRKGRLYRELLRQGPFDLAVLFFAETDAASHAFWRYRTASSEVHGRAPDGLEHAIRDVYAAIDREMAEIIAALPEGTNVCVVSLYGIQDEYPTSTLIDSLLRSLGYHVEGQQGDGGPGGSGSLAVARRLLPLGIREAVGRRLPTAAQERLLADRLRSATDWSRTTAFAIPSLFTSFVRVNLAGREPAGVVEPGAEYDEVLGRLCADLALLTDAATGEPAVRRAARTVELFGPSPPDSLPDLFVEWEPGPRMLTEVRHPRTTLVQSRQAYCPDSQERLRGFFAAAGPSITSVGGIGEIELGDIAPTLLTLLRRPPATAMAGRPLATVLK